MAEPKLKAFLGLAQKSEEEKKKEKLSKNPIINGKPNIYPRNGDKQFKLVLQGMQEGVERYYYWCLRFIQAEGAFGVGYNKVYKIQDVFKAGESSSFFGSTEQRKGQLQDKVSQYLRGISEMTKALFQLLRELRILDERLTYYEESAKGKESAEIALKSIWIDMVEGGAKNPGSVIGLAREVGFVTLPDIFFQLNPKDGKDGVDKLLNDVNVNKKVKEVLKRKLYQYYNWKEKTEQELKTRKKFMIKYLKQHYNTIKLYISWVRPYLQTIRRLQAGGESAVTDADIAAAFDTSKTELEFIAINDSYKKYVPVIRMRFKFVAIPQMAYHQEYQRGAIHAGRTEITIEPYLLTKEQLQEYLDKKDEEDLELVESLTQSLTSMTDDLKKYLKEHGEDFKEKEEKKEEEKKEGILEPFIALKDGVKEMFNLKLPKKSDDMLSEKEKVKSELAVKTWVMYDVFKKGHRMITP